MVNPKERFLEVWDYCNKIEAYKASFFSRIGNIPSSEGGEKGMTIGIMFILLGVVIIVIADSKK